MNEWRCKTLALPFTHYVHISLNVPKFSPSISPCRNVEIYILEVWGWSFCGYVMKRVIDKRQIHYKILYGGDSKCTMKRMVTFSWDLKASLPKGMRLWVNIERRIFSIYITCKILQHLSQAIKFDGNFNDDEYFVLLATFTVSQFLLHIHQPSFELLT